MASRTEREKMLAGELYNCLDTGLEIERQKVKGILRQFNLAETLAERQSILPLLLGHIGPNSIIEPPFHCVYGKNIHIGDHVFLNILCTILDCNEVHIGNQVIVWPQRPDLHPCP